MVKCESLRINMFRMTHTGKVSKFSRNSGITERCTTAQRSVICTLNTDSITIHGAYTFSKSFSHLLFPLPLPPTSVSRISLL